MERNEALCGRMAGYYAVFATCLSIVMLLGSCASLQTLDEVYEDLSYDLLEFIPDDTEATIAVYFFLEDGKESPKSEYVLNRLITAMATVIYDDSRPLTMVSRSALDRLLEEQSFQLSGLTDQAASISLGKLLGADIIVTGSISLLEYGYEINAQLIRVQNGAVLGGTVRFIPSE
ncbi:MAG: CsgG/HfaB family protein [Spirochaetia bacterium]|nr:CsgG/HfaB family protein [Spirochaetia bacterium]